MNANDLAAARRLIAEFEDRATGRHNSNEFNRRIDFGPQSPIAAFYAQTWRYCDVGDFTSSKPEGISADCEWFSVRPNVVHHRDEFGKTVSIHMGELWKFERVPEKVGVWKRVE